MIAHGIKQFQKIYPTKKNKERVSSDETKWDFNKKVKGYNHKDNGRR